MEFEQTEPMGDERGDALWEETELDRLERMGSSDGGTSGVYVPPRWRALLEAGERKGGDVMGADELVRDFEVGEHFSDGGLAAIVYPERIGATTSNPKFHLVLCGSLERQLERERGSAMRYRPLRTATPDLRVERVRRVNTAKEESVGWETVRFEPCRDCLATVGYDGFERNPPFWRRASNERKFERFSLAAYLGVEDGERVRLDDEDALPPPPPSVPPRPKPYYSSYLQPSGHRRDRSSFFTAIKQHAAYRCDECGQDFSEAPRAWFTLHHENRVPNDDRLENLRPLCLGCHTLQSGEGHRKLREGEAFEAFARHYPKHRAVRGER